MDVAGKTFIFRDGVSVEDTDGSACSFVSNGVTFYAIYADNNRIFYAEDAELSSYLTVRDGMGDWIDDEYKRIKFAADEEPFSGTFAVWFAATYVEEMVYLTYSESLEKVADAIRAKGGTSEALTYPDGFVAAINNIISPVVIKGSVNIKDVESGAVLNVSIPNIVNIITAVSIT